MEQLIPYLHHIIFFSFLSYYFYYIKTQKQFIDKRSISVQYDVPEEYTALQAGYVYAKFSDERDMSAAIKELANLGYIEIKNDLFAGRADLFRTEKEIDNLTEIQIYILDEILFKYRDDYILVASHKDEFTYTTGTGSVLDEDNYIKERRMRIGLEYIKNKLAEWALNTGHSEINLDVSREKIEKINLAGIAILFGLTLYAWRDFLEGGLIFIFLLSIGAGSFAAYGFINKTQTILSSSISLLISFLILFIFTINTGHSIIELFMSPFGTLFVLNLVPILINKQIGGLTQKGAYTQKHLQGFKKYNDAVNKD